MSSTSSSSPTILTGLLDRLPPDLLLLLRANRTDCTLRDTHGQVWTQITGYATKDPAAFQGKITQVAQRMVKVANVSRDIGRRMATLWENQSWQAMLTQWSRTAVGCTLFNLSLWTELSRFRVDDVRARL